MDELMKALRELAAKLGVAVEELFPNIVAYERMQGIASMLAVLGVFILGLLVGRTLFRVSEKAAERLKASDSHQGRDAVEVPYAIAWFVLVLGTVVFCVGIGVNLARVVEPTGAIIQRLLKL